MTWSTRLAALEADVTEEWVLPEAAKCRVPADRIRKLDRLQDEILRKRGLRRWDPVTPEIATEVMREVIFAFDPTIDPTAFIKTNLATMWGEHS